jgi:hypothetical protein
MWGGLVMYAVNYAVGWMLHFQIITMTKRVHQVIFGLLIITLTALLPSIEFLTQGFYLCALSLMMMLILPIGKKGGMYHRIVSTAGFVLYLILFSW